MMVRKLVIALCLLLSSVPTWASASRGAARSAPRSTSRSTAARSKSRSSATRYKTPATKCTSCARAANGKIARSPAARRSFRSSHPCPATGKTSGACRGYVVDHVVPLARISHRVCPGSRGRGSTRIYSGEVQKTTYTSVTCIMPRGRRTSRGPLNMLAG